MLQADETSGSSGSRLRYFAAHFVLSIVFILTFLLLSLPSALFFSKAGFTTWHPTNGLFLAVMVAVSPWYAVVGTFSSVLAGALIYHQPLMSFGETIGAVSTAGCYGTAAWVLRGHVRIDLTLSRRRDVGRYVAVTTVAAFGSTIAAVACFAADHVIPWTDFWSAASSWFVGDEIGLVGLTPFLFLYVFPWVRAKLSRQGHSSESQTGACKRKEFEIKTFLPQLAEGTGQFLVLVVVIGVIFWPSLGHLIFLSFVPILWMAMRHGVKRVSIGLVVLNVGIVLAMHWLPLPQLFLDRMGLFMFVVSASGLIVGTTVTAKALVESDLRERTVYLNSMIENSPVGIVVLNREGRVELSNGVFAKLFLFENEKELVGSTLHDLFPVDSTRENSPWSTDVMSGRSLNAVVRKHRRDGRTLDLELQAVPLVVDGGVRGAYAICRDISEQVLAEEAERRHAAALRALVQELELQTEQMTMLDEMATLLQCCSTIEEARSVVKTSAGKLFPETLFGFLYTFRSSRNLVEATVSWGDFRDAPPIFGPNGCWALRRGQPHWSDAATGAISCAHLSEMPAGKHLCVPMMGQGETLGVLCLGFPRVERESPNLSQSQLQLGAAVARQIALSLASLQLRETLRDQSVRDPLTRLFNRRFMEESIGRELARARRKKRSLSVLFLDIDHFKRFNDSYGHDAGDFVLQSVADLLLSLFRKDDVACRCGGEEFAVILPESPSEPAVARANVLRAEVKKLRLRYRDVNLGPITLSIGVATFPEHGSTPDDLLRIADQCLYQSKSSGRDRVTVASRIAGSSQEAPRI